MRDFRLSEKKEFTMSVNKAHKILMALQKVENDKKSDLKLSDRNARYSDDKSIDGFLLEYAMIVSYTQEELKTFLDASIAKKMTKFKDAIEILEDIKDIKEAIFHFNVIHGISEKLSYIEKKKPLLTVCELFNQKATSRNETLEALTNRLVKLSQNEFERNETIAFSFQYWDNDVIVQTLKTIKETVLKYEDEILSLNATHTITLSLYQSSVELIGL